MVKLDVHLLLLVYLWVHAVIGDYEVEVDFHSYSNPTGRCVRCAGGDPGCCDVSTVQLNQTCPLQDTCDTVLTYCIRTVKSTGLCPQGEQMRAPSSLVNRRSVNNVRAFFGLSCPVIISNTGPWQFLQILLIFRECNLSDNRCFTSKNIGFDLIDRIPIDIDIAVGTSIPLATYNGVANISQVTASIEVRCVGGFTGDHCETNIDDCAGVNCNNGTCMDEINNSTCACYTGFTGDHCETNIDDCEEVICSNGVCVDEISNFSCACSAGFTGDRCETNINDCEDINCNNNGICIDDFSCDCDTGFTGDHCEINIDYCEGVDCNNGICVEENEDENFRCDCFAGFTGALCLDGSAATAGAAAGAGSIAGGVAGGLIGVILIAIIVIIVVIVAVRVKRTTKAHIFNAQQNNHLQLFTVQSSFKLKVSKSLTVHSCNLQIGNTIGEGKFGIVYKALLKSSFRENFTETVAVKTLKGFIHQELVTDLLKECAKMKELDHPNVLPLRGVCLDGGPAPYIIMPFMVNGSLLSYLRENSNNLIVHPATDLDKIEEVKRKLLDMCIQVGRGMEYLASKRLVHRDLAARNCMIDFRFVIKVADFGLSESMDTSKDYFKVAEVQGTTPAKLPVKWMAPECFNYRKFSEKSDVWSYGVTCWEVFSGGSTPYPNLCSPSEIFEQLEKGHRLRKPLNAACTTELFSIIRTCWAFSSDLRPHFSELVVQLSHILSSMTGYLALGTESGGQQLMDTEDVNYAMIV